MKSIHFKRLFGRFNYNIKFCEDGLTILTGPNGFGKTTILRVIEALSKGLDGVNFLDKLDFGSIKLDLDDGKTFLIEKVDDKIFVNKKPLLKNDFIEMFWRRSSDDFFDFLRRRNRLLPIRGGNSNSYESVEEELKMLSAYRERFEVFQKIIKSKEDDLKNIAEKVDGSNEFSMLDILKDKVFFIHEQRLMKSIKDCRYYNEEDEIEEINQETVSDLPDNFREQIRKALRSFTRFSTRLDASFPKRLLNYKETFTKEDFEKRFEKIQEYNNRLSEYGLSVKFEKLIPEFNEEYSRALKIYCDDIDSKYAVYRNLITKLDLYREIVNERFKFKRCYINPRNGLVIKDGNRELELDELSSGEKQILVIFYELIFNLNKGKVLLIDEPEISLHIVWQEKFMDHLKRIIELNSCTAIVATHSPQIINNNWDNQVDLGGLYSAQLHNR